MMNYYEILEVSENASAEVIKASYRALMRKFHPDVYKGDKDFATDQVKIINEAYEILSDPKKRAFYDYDLRIRRESRRSSGSYGDESYRQEQSEKNKSGQTTYRANDTTYDYDKDGSTKANSSHQSNEEDLNAEKNTTDSEDPSSSANATAENEINNKGKSPIGKILIAILLILLAIGGCIAYSNYSQEKQWEENINDFNERKTDVLGTLFMTYPTEGNYLYWAGIKLNEGEDENYDEEVELNRLSRNDPVKFLNEVEIKGEKFEKDDGSYYTNYFEYLSANDIEEYLKMIKNDHKAWHTCKTTASKAVYGWYGIRVEDGVYYVEFRFDDENEIMEDGYGYYAFEVILPESGQEKRVSIIATSTALQEKYDEYYTNLW